MKACYVLVSILISCQILTNVNSKKTGDKCKVQRIYNDVTILGGLKAGLYIPYEGPEGLGDMTATKCTVYCCKKKNVVDMVFLINKYCYCISCYSAELCKPVPIKPPRGFSPVVIILNKDVLLRSTLLPTTAITTAQFTDHFTTVLPSATSHVWHESTRIRRTTRKQDGGRQTDNSKASLAVKNVYLPSSPRGDRDVLSSGKGQDNLTKLPPFTRPKIVTLPATPVPTTLRKTLAPTRLAEKSLTVEGTGNADITLRCKGSISVTRVHAFGIPGDKKSITSFNNYCKANLKKLDATNICIVSLKRVFKSQYPPFIKTKVSYNCKYVTREPA
ncbi:uncharacterized protein LOC110247854 isoform X3 [Exaiptasia diaphana]|uniref:Uncharacterized protein n=1 Tax=Exaiptasia diaphana TaxID=2652724 RepID=A0A913XUG4_EXADI|nr:uncharacterized protein LOC110247854 isoform X2 [Exaiptasia diaphana]XP_020909995.2 uncharacterized protein LOC110247854 isoform X3 [Exaiptasia diaphana]